MKVGILTFHCALNIGAQLQAYALCHTVESLGHDVKLINYSPRFLVKPYTIFNKAQLKYGIFSVIKQTLLHILHNDIPIQFRRIRNYKKFQKDYLSISDIRIYSADDLYKLHFDCIIVGSDQVWNPHFTGETLDAVYTLNAHLQTKKVSYAASLNNNSVDKSFLKELCYRLDSFELISVRESQIKNVLQPFMAKNIEVVLDPTLLLSRKQWLQIINMRRIVKGKYVLCHQARGDINMFNHIAEDFAHSHNCILINTTGTNYRKGQNNMQYIDPFTYMCLVQYAECIISASFHASATAIILEKPFYSISIGDGNDGREEDLLERLGLTSQILPFAEINKDIPKIDYNCVTLMLKKERGNSINFLKQALCQ